MWHLFPIKIDYSKLEQLLANKKWLEADQETAILYEQIVRKYMEEEGLYGLRGLDFLGSRQAQLFMGDLPCQKLETLDRLWLKYSNRQFGFSVQVQIFKSIPSDYNKSVGTDIWDRYKGTDIWDRYKIFEEKVGWQNRYRKNLDFYDYATPLDNAKGFFPSDQWMSYSPAPIYIAEPLESFYSCINNEN